MRNKFDETPQEELPLTVEETFFLVFVALLGELVAALTVQPVAACGKTLAFIATGFFLYRVCFKTPRKEKK